MYAGFHGLSAVPAGGTAGGQPGGYTPTLPGTNPGTPGSGATGDHPLYSPGLTQTAENQIAAETAQATNFPYVAKQFDTLGASRGEHTASMAAPIIASLQSQGDAAKANLHLADEVANRRQSLEDWVTRQKGNVGYATLLAQLLEAQQDAGNRLLSGQTNILTGLQEG